MGLRNKDRETPDRLDCKTLDAQFLTEVQRGLSCFAFEAQAVLQVVKEVCFPFLDRAQAQPPPGKINLPAAKR